MAVRTAPLTEAHADPGDAALVRLWCELIDQERATVVVPPNAAADGFWFGSGNAVLDDAGTVWLVGRYRDVGDSRTGLTAGARGLELALFRSDDGGCTFTKAASWSKADLSGLGRVTSIEGSALARRADGQWELYVSLGEGRRLPRLGGVAAEAGDRRVVDRPAERTDARLHRDDLAASLPGERGARDPARQGPGRGARWRHHAPVGRSLGGPRVERGLHYQFDLGATVLQMLGVEPPAAWDARGVWPELQRGDAAGRDALVVSQMAWSCQRAVRWGDWLLLRTFHPGLKDLPPLALYDVVDDPHQTRDIAANRPEVVADGLARPESWTAAQCARNPEGEDPMETVIAEGGPSLARGHEDAYEAKLRATGRTDQVARMRASGRAFVN